MLEFDDECYEVDQFDLSELTTHILELLHQKTGKYDAVKLATSIAFNGKIVVVLPAMTYYYLTHKFNPYKQRLDKKPMCLTSNSLLRTDWRSDIHIKRTKTDFKTTIVTNDRRSVYEFYKTDLCANIFIIYDIEIEVTTVNDIESLSTIFNAIKEIRMLGLTYIGATLFAECTLAKTAQVTKRTLKFPFPYSVNTGVLRGKFINSEFSSVFDKHIVKNIAVNIYHDNGRDNIYIKKIHEMYTENLTTTASDLRNDGLVRVPSGCTTSQVVLFATKRGTLETLPFSIDIQAEKINIEKLEENMYRITDKIDECFFDVKLHGLPINKDITVYTIHSHIYVIFANENAINLNFLQLSKTKESKIEKKFLQKNIETEKIKKSKIEKKKFYKKY